MRTETRTIHIGENAGPVNWEHPTAKDMPNIWRDAEVNPSGYLIDYGHGGREILDICMYDGWPYWEPRPAVCYVGPLGSAEWKFFNSYGVHANSIIARRAASLSKEREET